MAGRSVIDQIIRVAVFSTNTPLGANSSYTSPTIDALYYKAVSISLIADQTGSTIPQYSDDGINWFGGSSAYTGGNFFNNTLNHPRRYFRLVFTNGATPQTTFNASCYLSPL